MKGNKFVRALGFHAFVINIGVYKIICNGISCYERHKSMKKREKFCAFDAAKIRM